MLERHFVLSEFTGVDPDFDDGESDVAMMMHEIAATGRIELHPDGNRLSADFDPYRCTPASITTARSPS